MDMKKILQALDTASSKPVEGSNDMKKFLSVVTEGANPHKVTLPVQMAMQHYAEPVVAQPKPIKEVKKTAMSSMLYQYYTEAQDNIEQEAVAKKELISEQARRIAERVLAKESRVDELSKKTLQSYKSKAEDEADYLDKVGDAYSSDEDEKDFAPAVYKKADKRRDGAHRAGEKIAAKEGFDQVGNAIVKAGADARQAVSKAVNSIPRPFDEKEVAKDLKLQQVAKKESYNSAEYDQEGQSVKNSLLTTLRAVKGLGNMLGDDENLPEWCQEKISLAEDYLVTVWDYLQSEEGMQESRYGHRDAYQRDYDSSRSGFGRREREDDEYHVPDPVDNRIAYKVIATVSTQDGSEEKKGVTVKTTGGPKHAETVATKHLENAGLQVTGIVSVHDMGPV